MYSIVLLNFLDKKFGQLWVNEKPSDDGLSKLVEVPTGRLIRAIVLCAIWLCCKDSRICTLEVVKDPFGAGKRDDGHVKTK